MIRFIRWHNEKHEQFSKKKNYLIKTGSICSSFHHQICLLMFYCSQVCAELFGIRTSDFYFGVCLQTSPLSRSLSLCLQFYFPYLFRWVLRIFKLQLKAHKDQEFVHKKKNLKGIFLYSFEKYSLYWNGHFNYIMISFGKQMCIASYARNKENTSTKRDTFFKGILCNKTGERILSFSFYCMCACNSSFNQRPFLKSFIRPFHCIFNVWKIQTQIERERGTKRWKEKSRLFIRIRYR